MSAGEYFLRGDLEALRRDGSVTTLWTTAEAAARWRAGMRRLCRAAGLRVRTGASQGQGGTARPGTGGGSGRVLSVAASVSAAVTT